LLALECHTNTALIDAPATRVVLDAVSSPWLKVHLDPVNWITPATIFRTGAAIEAMFDVLRPEAIYGAHAKGVALEDRLIVHLNETDAGAADDRLDYPVFLRRLDRLGPDTYLVIEHTPVERIPAARDFIRRVAAGEGIVIR
jgi:sugar phosphate isomerase/epimerase